MPYAFPPNSIVMRVFQQIKRRLCHHHHCHTHLDNSALVANTFSLPHRCSKETTMSCSIVPPMEPSPGTSAWEQDISCQSRGVRGLTCHYNISSEAQKCIEFFHRDNTRIHCGCEFCDRWHADPYRPTVTLVVDFLTEQFDNGKSNLGVVTNAHSALEIYFPHYIHV